MNIKSLQELLEKQGFAIVVSCGLLFFAWNVYGDSLDREQRLSNRIDSFDSTLKEFGGTLRTIDSRLDKIEGYTMPNGIPAASSNGGN